MAKIDPVALIAVMGLLFFCGCVSENKPVATSSAPNTKETGLPEVTSTAQVPVVTPATLKTINIPSGWSIVSGVSSEGFTARYAGYAFKIDHFIYSGDYSIAGVLLDVRKPDGTVVQVQASKTADGLVDDLRLKLPAEQAKEDGNMQTANIYVLQTSAETGTQTAENEITTTTLLFTPIADGRVKLVNGLTNEGFVEAYNGYRFKIDDFLYSEDGKISGIILDAQRPDGSVDKIQISGDEFQYVDNLQITFPSEYATDSGGRQTAAINVIEMLE